MSIVGELDQVHVTDVAEMAVEPSYISEIARKLREVDPTWQTFSENGAVRRVSRAVQALLSNNENIEITEVGYDKHGGQRESSRKYSFSEDGVSSTTEWNDYIIVYNTVTEIDDVQEHLREVIDPSVTVQDKIEVIDFISRQGNRAAKFSERVLQDHVSSVVNQPDVIERSSYNDPGLDVYVENFRSSFDATSTFGHGLGIEISTRWVNPIDDPYVGSKINMALDKEAERGVQVDLIIMAPKFTQKVMDRYEDSDIVTLEPLPFDADGNPIIVEDDQDTIQQARGSDLVGPGYPVVDGFFEQFQDDLELVLRDFSAVRELDYRRQISTIIGQVF